MIFSIVIFGIGFILYIKGYPNLEEDEKRYMFWNIECASWMFFTIVGCIWFYHEKICDTCWTHITSNRGIDFIFKKMPVKTSYFIILTLLSCLYFIWFGIFIARKKNERYNFVN